MTWLMQEVPINRVLLIAVIACLILPSAVRVFRTPRTITISGTAAGVLLVTTPEGTYEVAPGQSITVR